MPRAVSSDSPALPDGPARRRPYRWLAIAGAVLGAAVLLALAALAVTFILANRSYARAYTARLALDAGGMGLGEYTWIYAAAYFGALGQAPVRVLERQGEPSLFEARVFPAVARAMRRHVDALGTAEAAAAWADELARLEHDPSRVPFAAGLPPELAASLAPHRIRVRPPLRVIP